ncbi:hypothetical protein TNCV_4369341 [Trichonephila clavipes]|nr:hypothetical protein TNCV_4369341 [Trichonephila clavipes]
MGHFLKSRIYSDVTGLRYIVQPCLLFTTPAFFRHPLSSPPFRPFSPLSLPDPLLYLVSCSTCCQVQAVVPYNTNTLNPKFSCCRYSLEVSVTDSWLEHHEFEPSTAEDSPCTGGWCPLNILNGRTQTFSRWCGV